MTQKEMPTLQQVLPIIFDNTLTDYMKVIKVWNDASAHKPKSLIINCDAMRNTLALTVKQKKLIQLVKKRKAA